jgi:hypothetical protein
MRVGIDANLFLLLTVGLADQRIVRYHKRLQRYSVDGFERLAKFVELAGQVVVTPHVLAETANLMQFGLIAPDIDLVRASFKVLVKRCEEVWIEAERVVNEPEFDWLGLSDACWLSAIDERSVLLSDDNALLAAAMHRGIPTLSFDLLMQS